jgi:DNA-binding transcriptional MerR regulator
MGKIIYSIGEIAEKTGVSIRTLHFYDEKGLLIPEKHPSSGHRIYSDWDIKALHKIMTLKFLGYRLDQISEMIHKSSFDIGLMDFLQMQQKKLEKDKEQINVSLSSIKRTMALIKSEGEVDSNILMSLISSMQTEKEQREWAEKFMDERIVDNIFQMSEEQKMEWEKASAQFYKKVKKLAGKPVEDEEVEQLLHDYFSLAFGSNGKETFDEIATVFSGLGSGEFSEEYYRNIEAELERLVPTPLTEEELKWFDEVLESFIEKYDGGDFLK